MARLRGLQRCRLHRYVVSLDSKNIGKPLFLACACLLSVGAGWVGMSALSCAWVRLVARPAPAGVAGPNLVLGSSVARIKVPYDSTHTVAPWQTLLTSAVYAGGLTNIAPNRPHLVRLHVVVVLVLLFGVRRAHEYLNSRLSAWMQPRRVGLRRERDRSQRVGRDYRLYVPSLTPSLDACGELCGRVAQLRHCAGTYSV
jgi:hypothetical protein